MSNLILTGTNHKTAPLEIRERLSLTKKGIENALALLGGEGVVILSTCNRTEFYINGDIDVKGFIYKYYKAQYPKLEPYLYACSDIDAVRHLFRVAGGLDSQILGETQILGQVKSAYETGRPDSLLDKIFTKALDVGRRIRRETRISEGNVSIGSVAVDLIKERVPDLSDKKIIIIGVGKVSSLVMKYLSKEGAETVFVSNRTYEKAVELAGQINGKAVRFDNVGEYIVDADVIISTTGCPHTILHKEDFKVYKSPLLIVDLAVPRDVSPLVKELSGIELLCLDDIHEIIEDNINKKKAAIPFAEEIIREELEVLHAGLFELAGRVE